MNDVSLSSLFLFSVAIMDTWSRVDEMDDCGGCYGHVTPPPLILICFFFEFYQILLNFKIYIQFFFLFSFTFYLLPSVCNEFAKETEREAFSIQTCGGAWVQRPQTLHILFYLSDTHGQRRDSLKTTHPVQNQIPSSNHESKCPVLHSPPTSDNAQISKISTFF